MMVEKLFLKSKKIRLRAFLGWWWSVGVGKEVGVLLHLIFFLSGTSAQTLDTIRLQKILEIPVSAKLATGDPFQNTYLITQENQLIKFDSQGKELFRYSNDRLGDITSINAGNPLQILIYYDQYQTAQILDRTLTPMTTISFLDIQIWNPSCINLSKDKNLWVYDSDQFQLKKITTKGSTLIESQDLSQILNTQTKPQFLRQNSTKIFMLMPGTGIYVFDSFGKYINKIPDANLIDFQPIRNKLLLLKKEKLVVFDLDTSLSTEYWLPDYLTKNANLYLANNHLLLVAPGSVQIFKIVVQP